MDKDTKKFERGELFDEAFEFKQIVWKIPNVLSLPEFADYKVQTPSFTFANATWKIVMYPYGLTGHSEGHIDLYIERLDTQITKHHLFYKICFKTCHGKEFESYSNNKLFNSNSESFGVRNFIKKSKFIAMKKVLAPNGVLTVICEMRTKKIAVSDRCSQIEPTTPSLKPSFKKSEQEPDSSSFTCKGSSILCHPMTLSGSNTLSDLRELFLKQEDCDVNIKVKDQEFFAHRIILKARSSVFASTFRNDMKEKATGIIDIEDCDPSSFSDFLHFLYCGNVENLSTGNVFSLFTTADKYDVQDLRSECMEFIKKNLSVDTFCETITLALQHSEKELIELTANFFAKNFQEIIVTVKWQSFILENPIQSNELMIKAFVSNKKK